MVEITHMPSSPSPSSSSSSSGDDSSSSSGSSTTSFHSIRGNAGQAVTTKVIGSTSHEAEASILNHSSGKTVADSCKPVNETIISLDGVVRIDSKPASEPSNATVAAHDNIKETTSVSPPPSHQEEDHFPFFQSDDSSTNTMIPDKPSHDLFDNGLSDDDLAKLLDSPHMIAKQQSPHDATTITKPAAVETTSRTYASPRTFIDTDNLEIPHSTTPEEASRFFSKSGGAAANNKNNTVSRRQEARVQTTANKTATTTQSHETIRVTTSNFTEEGASGPPLNQIMSTYEQPQQDNEPLIMERHHARSAEVDPSLYQPLPYHRRPDPSVHHLSIHNRPKSQRQSIAVQELFSKPLNNFWRSKFDTFNHLQSEVANTLTHSDDSIVVSAPTGAGKTALFEIAMARFFAADLCANGSAGQVTKQRKIVYVAPSKALCEERYDDWTRRLSDINAGIVCAMITGDSAEPGEAFREVAAAHVILTTPEKWDSLTRRWTENVYMFGSVKLLLLDEVHLLGDGTRGCCLESIVCRMKTIQRAAVAASQLYDAHSMSSYTHTSREALSSFLRIVGVSATLPNVSSIAAFLEANEAYSFDASYRPVPLKTHVVGLGWAGKNAFMFGKSLDRHVPDLIKRFSRSKATIVFCHTKKETETLAMELSKVAGIGLPNNGGNMTLASQTKLTALQGSLLRGIAYHHAGLDATDRKLVETAFMNGKVMVLCATSTLAMGVNLPAHLVMIKGTTAWRGSGQGHQEIDTGTLLQMIGRAGRPGFDTSGTAVIMTDNASKPKYEKLSGGMEVVESHLPARLMDVMNTEISQRVISSFEATQNWIKSTFFFRRAIENPEQYGLSSSKSEIEEFMDKSCLQSLERLNEEGIITFDDSGKISPNPGCHIMSQHMIDFESMKRIIALPFDADQPLLLKMLAECDRLHRPVRRSEKKPLNEAHKMIRFKLDGPPSKVKIQTPAEKAFVLLQAAIGQQYLEDFTLRQEMSYMVEYATRMLSAVEEYCVDGSHDGQVALQSLRLRRSLATSLWGASDGVLNQLRGVGHKTTAKLRFSKILSFVDVLSSSSEEIERAAGREAPFGKELRTAVSKILKNTLQLSACMESEGDALKFVVCSLTRRGALPGIEHVESDKSAGIVSYTLVAFTDRPSGSIVFQPNISSEGEYRLPCPPTLGTVHVHLIASMVGLDECLTLDGNDDVLESAITATASDKKKRSRKKQTPASLSPASEDVRIKRKPAGKRKAKQQTIESSYAGAKRLRTTSSQPLTSATHANQSRKITSQPGRQRESGTSTANQQTRVQLSTFSVTPSPIPEPANTNTAFLAQPTHFRKEYRPPPAQLGSTRAEHLRGNRSSNWHEEKRRQKNLQQNALHLQKDKSLFSSYAYDPNDMEASLTSSATKSVSPHPRDDSDSVLPPHTYTAMKQASATKTRSISRSGRKRGGSRSNRGRGRLRSFPKMDDRELLQMKAREQQAYAAQAGQANIYHHQQARERYVQEKHYPSVYEHPSSSGLFPAGHDFAGPVLRQSTSVSAWNDDRRFVTQSQPAFSQPTDDAGYNWQGHPNEVYNHHPQPNSAFGPVSLQQNQGYYESMPAHPFGSSHAMQLDHPNSAFETFSSPYQGYYESMPVQAFGAPQNVPQQQGVRSSHFMSQPPMETRRVFEEAGPTEEDELFDAAFL